MQPGSKEVRDKVFPVALEALLQLHKAVSAAMHAFQVNIQERLIPSGMGAKKGLVG